MVLRGALSCSTHAISGGFSLNLDQKFIELVPYLISTVKFDVVIFIKSYQTIYDFISLVYSDLRK